MGTMDQCLPRSCEVRQGPRCLQESLNPTPRLYARYSLGHASRRSRYLLHRIHPLKQLDGAKA